MGIFQSPLAGAIEGGLGRIEGGLRHSATPTPSEPPPQPATPAPVYPAADLIQAQDAARKQFGAKPGLGPTYCNDATYAIARQLKAPLGPLGNSMNTPYTANQMAQNLALSTAYKDVTPEQAQQMADQGRLVIGAWHNPGGHGHVVTVRPQGVPGDQPAGNTGPLLNDIGRNDCVARQSGAFEPTDRVDYYTPS